MNHPYLPLTESHRRSMLEKIGLSSFEELLKDIPQELRLNRPLELPPALTEIELRREFETLFASQPAPSLSFLGAGSYQHFIPALVDNLAGRSEFYTAYTPYQPEISQGMLQAIFEYQTLIARLFDLPIANASLYDGPTALAEAVLMVAKETKKHRFLIPGLLSPHLKRVLETYTKPWNIELAALPEDNGQIEVSALENCLNGSEAALIIQNPNYFGIIENMPELIKAAKSRHLLVICYVHPLLMGIVESPGALGADIVVGEGQPLGIPVSYGGPYLGLFAAGERFLRKIPGRIVGETKDRTGKRAFVLTLQTREQHIRREKATSNICSNQALCALRAAIYLTVLGPEGFKETALRAYSNAHYLQAELMKLGLKPLYDAPFFIEFAVRLPKPAAFYQQKLIPKGIFPGLDLGRYDPTLNDALLICATEVFSKEELDTFISELGGLL
ncbi:MAG: aminomethyl-transferring glycine dehydrogenase subunit GcvPA [Firmicutes bacterium]|nr:aminomethyl-transferring glycine dehydrogenase subunit GcvPA [Bacillota bacterium]